MCACAGSLGEVCPLARCLLSTDRAQPLDVHGVPSGSRWETGRQVAFTAPLCSITLGRSLAGLQGHRILPKDRGR